MRRRYSSVIIDQLGQSDLLLPSLIAEGLAARDQASPRYFQASAKPL